VSPDALGFALGRQEAYHTSSAVQRKDRWLSIGLDIRASLLIIWYYGGFVRGQDSYYAFCISFDIFDATV